MNFFKKRKLGQEFDNVITNDHRNQINEVVLLVEEHAVSKRSLDMKKIGSKHLIALVKKYKSLDE